MSSPPDDRVGDRSATFVFWHGRAGDLPVAWDEVERRIAERRARHRRPD